MYGLFSTDFDQRGIKTIGSIMFTWQLRICYHVSRLERVSGPGFTSSDPADIVGVAVDGVKGVVVAASPDSMLDTKYLVMRL